MDYTRHSYHQSEAMFAAANANFQLPTGAPMYSPRHFNPFNDEYFGLEHEPQDSLHPSQLSASDDVDDGEGGTRPRLTQEQINQLERTFSQIQKPKTDFKKKLAKQMSLPMQRVNNWFQNRRAKAKHQKPPGHECSTSPDDENCSYTPFTYINHDAMAGAQISTASLYHHTSTSSSDFANAFNPNSLDGFDQRSNTYLDTTTNALAHTSTYSANDPFSSGFQFGVEDPMWPDQHNSSMPHLPIQMTFDHDSSNWSPQSSVDLSAHTQALETPHRKSDQTAESLYRDTIRGNPQGNSSGQAFVTDASSQDGLQDLMTPPTMPWLSQEFTDRRGSDSSELANNFDTIHLQGSQTGLGLSNLTFDNSEHSPPTQTSPPQPGSDIAYRRRRQRPTPLQSEAPRSQSFGRPLTMSPHERAASQRRGSSPSGRRIKSTSNLRVAAGKIQKPISNSAQPSPHTPHFKEDLWAEAHRRAAQNINGASASPMGMTWVTPAPTTTFVPQPSPAPSWHHYNPHGGNNASTWEQSPAYSLPAAFASVPNLQLPPTPPTLSEAISYALPERIRNPQQSTYHEASQSAPANQTTFFEGTSALPYGAFTPPNWQGTPHTPPETYGNMTKVSVPRAEGHYVHHSYGGVNVPFAPPPNALHNGIPGTGLFAIGQPQPKIEPLPTPPRSELEIKVELGPTPSLRSTAEKYDFHHSTPSDFTPGGPAKKS